MAVETPKERFLRFCPGGFSDHLFLNQDYKVAAHEMWCDLLNETEFNRLLELEQDEEICRRALCVEAKVGLLLSQYENAALHDAVQGAASAQLFANGLFDLIYGKDDFQNRFEEFGKDLASLPQKKTSPVKWTIATIFPFLAQPKTHIFLKPKVTQEAARRRGFSLNYRAELNWLTYSCLLRFADVRAEEVADLNPRDMIDIQSYIWVTEYWNRDS